MALKRKETPEEKLLRVIEQAEARMTPSEVKEARKKIVEIMAEHDRKYAAKEHGGACPTCGHCKCCEKQAQPVIQYPICTRPHYPATTWPWVTPIWYGMGTGNEPALTTTVTAYQLTGKN